MPLIGTLLLSYWKPLGLLALMLLAFGYREVLVHQRDAARLQAAQLTAEANALRTSNQALTSAIDQQNAAVAQIKARADAAINTMAANAAAALRAGTATQAEAQQQAQTLMAASIDASSGCEGAIRWGNAQAAELSSW
jgi:threonine dehydrogenase-like Zn-dependent dehydrogenase